MTTGPGFLTDRNILIVLAVGTLVIGFRTVSVSIATAREAARDVREGTMSGVQRNRLVRAVAHQDSLLSAKSRVPRNPFGPPPPDGQAKPVAPKVEVKPVVPPRVRLLAVEASRKTTVLEVEGELSGNLSEGETFRGWTVVLISTTGVRVERDGIAYTLPKP